MSSDDSVPSVSSVVNSDLSTAVAQILAAADADIAARKPLCQASGRCCKFEQYGHRLYVTAAELHHFAATHLPPPANPDSSPPIGNRQSAIGNPLALPQFFSQKNPTGCPYQINNLCTAREARPLGCRLYFCDENAQSWQNEVYEKYHAMLRDLHSAHGVPYRYLEWRAALRELTG